MHIVKSAKFKLFPEYSLRKAFYKEFSFHIIYSSAISDGLSPTEIIYLCFIEHL